MANTDRPNGFRPANGHQLYDPKKWGATAAQTIAIGDMVIMDSAGRISVAGATSGAVCGVAASAVASATADDAIYIWDNPMQIFEGQCSGDGALADPYTCATATQCFDIEDTTGSMEINENSSTYDIVKVIGVGKDPATGLDSAVGANQRKLFVINKGVHQLGVQT